MSKKSASTCFHAGDTCSRPGGDLHVSTNSSALSLSSQHSADQQGGKNGPNNALRWNHMATHKSFLPVPTINPAE
jgi:hypothetical protein